jgi:hypothetical protein
LGLLRLRADAGEHLDESAQKPLEPARQQVEVEAGGGEDWVTTETLQPNS